MHYNIESEAEKYFFFIKKKKTTVGMEMRRGYPNSLGRRMRFDFSSMLDMDRVTCKYLGVGYENG